MTLTSVHNITDSVLYGGGELVSHAANMEKIQLRYNSNTNHLHHKSKASSISTHDMRDKDLSVKIDVDFYSHNKWLQRKIHDSEIKAAVVKQGKLSQKSMARLQDGDADTMIPEVFATEQELKRPRARAPSRLRRVKSAGEIHGVSRRTPSPRTPRGKSGKQSEETKLNHDVTSAEITSEQITPNSSPVNVPDMNHVINGKVSESSKVTPTSPSFVERSQTTYIIDDVIEENDEEEQENGVHTLQTTTPNTLCEQVTECTTNKHCESNVLTPRKNNEIRNRATDKTNSEVTMQMFYKKGTRCFESTVDVENRHPKDNRQRRSSFVEMLKRMVPRRSSYSCHDNALSSVEHICKKNKIRPKTALGRLQNISEAFYEAYARKSPTKSTALVVENDTSVKSRGGSCDVKTERPRSASSTISLTDENVINKSQFGHAKQQKHLDVIYNGDVRKRSDSIRSTRSRSGSATSSRKTPEVDPKPLINFLKLVKTHPDEYVKMKQNGYTSDIDLRLVSFARIYNNFTTKENIVQTAANEVHSRFLEQTSPVTEKITDLKNPKRLDVYQKQLTAENNQNEQVNKDGLSELQQSRRQVEKWLSTLSMTHILKARDLALAEVDENQNDNSWWEVNKSCRYLRFPCSEKEVEY